MTDMSELIRRKKPLNLAIVHVDPDAFLEHYRGWLEITAFIKAQLRTGELDCGVALPGTARLSSGLIFDLAEPDLLPSGYKPQGTAMASFIPCKGKTACHDDGTSCLACGRSLNEIEETRRLIDALAELAIAQQHENVEEFVSYVARKVESKVNYRNGKGIAPR